MMYTRKQTVTDDRRDDQLRFLYELAGMAPDGPAVECGVYTGGSLVCWACARLGRGPLWAVDDWSLCARADFEANAGRYGLAVRIVDGKSYEVHDQVDDGLAFCFVDADHKDGIARDIAIWPGKVRPGGVIAFHDYGVWRPEVEVKAAVDAWQAEAGWIRINGVVSSLIGFRRPA